MHEKTDILSLVRLASGKEKALFAACRTADVKTGPDDIDSRGSFGD